MLTLTQSLEHASRLAGTIFGLAILYKHYTRSTITYIDTGGTTPTAIAKEISQLMAELKNIAKLYPTSSFLRDMPYEIERLIAPMLYGMNTTTPVSSTQPSGAGSVIKATRR